MYIIHLIVLACCSKWVNYVVPILFESRGNLGKLEFPLTGSALDF